MWAGMFHNATCVMTNYRNRIKALEYIDTGNLVEHPGGVYAIRNTANGKCYVGSSSNVKARWRTHLKLLRAGRHYSKHMQSAWNAYGPDAFEFALIETVDDASRLTDREQYWIDSLQTVSPEYGYNSRPLAESSRGRKASDEERARLSAARMGNKNALGTKQSQETIDKRRASLRGRTWKMSEERKQSPEYRAWRERHAGLMRGRKHDWHTSIPQETRDKISVSVKAARSATLKVYEGFIDPNGNPVGPIKGMGDFCAEHGLTRANMEKVYSGERRSHKGWTVRRD